MSWNFTHDCSSNQNTLAVDPDETDGNSILFQVYYVDDVYGLVYEYVSVPLAEAKKLAQQILDTEEVSDYAGLDEAT